MNQFAKDARGLWFMVRDSSLARRFMLPAPCFMLHASGFMAHVSWVVAPGPWLKARGSWRRARGHGPGRGRFFFEP